MKIMHISAECYPVAKAGGLADVVGSLPKYQNKIGEESAVIMPFYDTQFTKEHSFKNCHSSTITLSKPYTFNILKLENSKLGQDIYFVDIPKLLFTNNIYTDNDTERFLAFQISALNFILQLKEKPEIIHCHDHHTGLIPFMLSHCFDYSALKEVPTVLTIHNAQYQGWFSHNLQGLLPAFNNEKAGLLDWDGCINPLATAIKCAWKVTTVSPSYMEELKIKANGLESLLAAESQKCTGVLNGIDTKVWNPETDTFIQKNYSIKDVEKGKKANKDWLCKEFNLNPKLPLFAFIGRLVGEKGADLFSDIFEKALNKNKINILLLGSGNKETEVQLEALKPKFEGNYNAMIGYDEKLSHIIYAGADFLLMPSRVEPCGLNQMYSLRYGTIPIVNKVGGLIDTVDDIKKKNGFGIVHDGVTFIKVNNAIKRGVSLYGNVSEFKKIRKQTMAIDHSWEASAQTYVTLYKSLI